MAPEIAIEECSSLAAGSVVFDPMMGSGTTLAAAVAAGCSAIGTDLDPLAVLISRVRLTPIETHQLMEEAKDVAARALKLRSFVSDPPRDMDATTVRFIEYWFAIDQRKSLLALRAAIDTVSGSAIRAALLVAMSRLIVTKDSGASLARDVSHSRPHRVKLANEFDVIRHFLIVVDKLCRVLADRRIAASSYVGVGDARQAVVSTGGVDAVVTSPPYLNAIDYLRGHRLSLVWLGYSVKQIRAIRSSSVGAERSLHSECDEPALEEMREAIGDHSKLPHRHQRIVDRYLIDLLKIFAEIARVVRNDGKVITVVGNSTVRGVFLSNDEAVVRAAACHNLQMIERTARELPPGRRYLPPPSSEGDGGSRIASRMRMETILRFRRIQ